MASANEAWRTIKKAIAIVKPRINADGSPKESGLSPEDIQEFVLEKMYPLLKKIGDNTGKSLGDGTDDDANKEAAANDVAEVADEGDNKRPCNWFFNGWFSFLL